MQREKLVSSHTFPNRLHEHMIPSQLLRNEVFLGCKRRVASCSLLFSIILRTNTVGGRQRLEKHPGFEGRAPRLHETVDHRFQTKIFGCFLKTRPSTTRRRDLNYNQCVSAQPAGIACLVSYGSKPTA